MHNSLGGPCTQFHGGANLHTVADGHSSDMGFKVQSHLQKTLLYYLSWMSCLRQKPFLTRYLRHMKNDFQQESCRFCEKHEKVASWTETFWASRTDTLSVILDSSKNHGKWLGEGEILYLPHEFMKEGDIGVQNLDIHAKLVKICKFCVTDGHFLGVADGHCPRYLIHQKFMESDWGKVKYCVFHINS